MLAVLLLLAAPGVRAQNTDADPSRPGPTVSVYGFYQQYEDAGRRLTQVSIPWQIALPLSPALGLRLAATPASVTGPEQTALRGLGDTQVSLVYLQPLPAGSLALTLDAALPTGEQKLTAAQFETSLLLSQDYLGFLAPSVGQGISVTPGAVWAIPLNRSVTVALGLSYSVRGAYRPLLDLDARYDPGDELGLRAGLDAALSPATTLAADLYYTTYGDDKVGGVAAFRLGSLTRLHLRLVRQRAGRLLTLQGQAEYRRKSTLPGDDVVIGRTVPNRRTVEARYQFSVRGQARIGLVAAYRNYGDTLPVVSPFYRASLQQGVKHVVDVGLAPGYLIRTTWLIQAQGLYTLGDVTGFSAGLGTTIQF